MPESFDVSLVTPERQVWSGKATFVIARGTEGELGILNGHVPVLIQLAIGPLFIDPADGSGRIAAAVDGGFLHCVSAGGETRVDVLGESAELSTEINADMAQALRSDAERRIQADHDADALGDLARAMTRLDLVGRG